jgi:origin recognition complex subunit 3
VIAFQDTESFPINVISEFIIRNQDRLKRLPVILLFGVASTLDQFQLMLPSSVIKILDTRIFEVRQDDECLKIIIDRVQVSKISTWLTLDFNGGWD